MLFHSCRPCLQQGDTWSNPIYLSHILLFILIHSIISVSHIPILMRFTFTYRNLFSYLFVCILHLSIFDFYVLSMYFFTNFALIKRFNMNINLNFNWLGNKLIPLSLHIVGAEVRISGNDLTNFGRKDWVEKSNQQSWIFLSVKQLENLSDSNGPQMSFLSRSSIEIGIILFRERGETFRNQDITQFWWKTSSRERQSGP